MTADGPGSSSSRAKLTWMVTKEFSVLPSRPHHCVGTPGVLSPFPGSLAPSKIPMVWVPGAR